MTLQFDPKGELITGSEMSFLRSLHELVEKMYLAAAKGRLLTGKGELRGQEAATGRSRKSEKVGGFLITAQLSLQVINLVIKVNSVRHAWIWKESPKWIENNPPLLRN